MLTMEGHGPFDVDDPDVPRSARAAGMYLRGARTPEIARRLGVSHSTVRAAARRHGVPMRARYTPYALSPKKEAAVVHAIRSGSYAREVARAQGVSVDAVLRVVRRHGLPVAPPSRPRVLRGEKRHKVVALYEGGATMRQVSENLGVSENAVAKILEESSVTRRPPARGPRGPLAATLARAQRARELYESGLTYAQVGETLGVRACTALRLARAAGARTRPRGQAASGGRYLIQAGTPAGNLQPRTEDAPWPS